MATKYYSRHGVFMARTSVSRSVNEILRNQAARAAAAANENDSTESDHSDTLYP